MSDFIYERIKTPAGVKLEIITGGTRYKGKVWREIALQIYCENGKDGFREIGHFQSGAPFLYDADERISISDTEGCLVVATIPTPADANLSEFSPATALGVDVEKIDREKALKLRERFLLPEEMSCIPDSVEANVIAWTCKEAMLKANMDTTIDWLRNIVISDIPLPDKAGKGWVMRNGEKIYYTLQTLRYDDFIITVAIPQK